MIGSTVKMRGLDQGLNKSTLYVFIQLALHIFIYVSCMVEINSFDASMLYFVRSHECQHQIEHSHWPLMWSLDVTHAVTGIGEQVFSLMGRAVFVHDTILTEHSK